MDRREFLATLSALTAGLMVPAGHRAFAQAPPAESAAATGSAPLAPTETPEAITGGSDALGEVLPLRKLGATGLTVTMLGVGGAHLGGRNDAEAQAIIEAALENGIRFFDNSEDYSRGRAEEHFGKFLAPKYREQVFIMTKTNARSRETAKASLERSLSRMNCDYLDLWQIHEFVTNEDVDARLDGGVLEYMLEAKAEGKVRHIGYTGHSFPSVMNHTLAKSGEWETVQMPVNVLDPNRLSFVRDVLPGLTEKKVGVLAMKTLAGSGFFGGRRGGAPGANVVPDRLSVEQALHFAWSMPIATLISGMDNAGLVKQNADFARGFKGMTESDRQALVAKVADLADAREWYKERTQVPREV